jgi:hypothetical protein
MHLRLAKPSDEPVIVDICFLEEDLFGRVIHPYRAQYSNGVQIFWHDWVRNDWANPRNKIIVAVTTAEGSEHEKIIGAAIWQRQGDDPEDVKDPTCIGSNAAYPAGRRASLPEGFGRPVPCTTNLYPPITSSEWFRLAAGFSNLSRAIEPGAFAPSFPSFLVSWKQFPDFSVVVSLGRSSTFAIIPVNLHSSYSFFYYVRPKE